MIKCPPVYFNATGVPSPDIKATQQFQELKLELTRAIVDAHD